MRFKYFLLLLCLPGCATSDLPSQSRHLASESVISPFKIGTPKSYQDIVDRVIQELGPARNQQDTQICFGQAVADVATFHSRKRVSAFSVAVRYFQNRKGVDYIFFNPAGVIASQLGSDSRYMLGLASSALDSIRQATLCSEDQPSSGLSYRDENLRQLWDVYQNQFRSYTGSRAPEGLYRKIQNQLSHIAPSLNSDDFVKHISRYKPLDHAIGEWFDRNCNVRLNESTRFRVVGNETGLVGTNQILAIVNEGLERSEPVVIHYDPGVLDAENPSIWQTAIGFHVSLIVARVDTREGRKYLLRNSWGSNCRIYANSVASRCDRGHIWLTEEEVRKYVSSAAYLRSDD